MSKLPIKKAIYQVNKMFNYETDSKFRFLDILEPLEKIEKQNIIDAYNKGRDDCKHERPIENYNSEKYYEHLQNLH